MHQLPAIIAPSLLSGDFAKLAEEANRMLDLGADYLHMDVMDGHFVNNLTIGPPVIQSLRKHTKGFLDCHLMVTNPEKWIDNFCKFGADGITFHWETTENPKDLIEKIHDHYGKKASISLKPKTKAEETIIPLLEKYPELLPKVHMILVMTVEPGFGGQPFMADQMHKVQLIRQKFPHLNIQVDGGLDEHTVHHATKAGANIIVAGSSIFKSEDPKGTIEKLRQSVLFHALRKGILEEHHH